MLDYVRGFLILVAFQLLGWLLQRVGVPIPGGVLGLLVFFLALSAGLVKLKWVERAAGLLLRHMVLLFVPLTVGLMDMGQVLSRQALPIVASLLVSLVAVFLTTGLLARWLLPPEPVLPGLPLPSAENNPSLSQTSEAAR
jgi:holin-like protein